MAVINKNSDFVAMPLGFKRGNPIALDTSAVWYSYEEMNAYAASSPIAYVGQILSLVDGGTNKATAYMIMDTAGTLQEVGKVTLGDERSITLNDSTLSLKNWGVQYYKWVDGEGENPGSHVLQVVDENNPWIAGLEPKVTLEKGKLVIAWYQPSNTTVEGVNSTLTSLQTTINGIAATLGTKDDVIGTDTIFGALAGKIDASGATMTGVLTLADGSAAASETVVDTKIANAIGSAGHLKRLIVDALPEVSAVDADTIYMVKDASVTLGDAYKEYMLIDGAMIQIGDTSVNLEPYATKAMLTAHEEDAVAHITAEERTAWNSKVDSTNETYVSLASNAEKLAQLPTIKSIGTGLTLQEDGTLIGAQEYGLPIATDTVLGGVKVDNRTTETTDEGVLSIKVVAENGLSATDNGIAMALASEEAAGAMSAEQFTKLANIASGAGTTEFTSAKLIKSITQDEGGKITGVIYEDIIIPSVVGLTDRLSSIDTEVSKKLNADVASAAASTSNKLIDTNAAQSMADTAESNATSAAASDADSKVRAAKTALLGTGGTEGTHTIKGAYDAAAAVDTKISNLDIADTGAADKFVYEVDQTDGKIAVTRKSLTEIVGVDGTYNSSTNKLATVSTVTDAINGLDSSVSATAVANNKVSVLTGITQTNGKLTAKTEKTLEAIAKTGNINDLIQTSGDVLVLYGGNATTVI